MIESPEELEARCAALRQSAGVIADFYRALIDQPGMSTELAHGVVMSWWDAVGWTHADPGAVGMADE